jgi:hypothetical protein
MRRSTHIHSYSSLLLALLLSVTLVACDSGGSDGDDGGGTQFANEFSFEITESTASATNKSTAATLNGFSFFFEGTDPETDSEAFVLYFTGEDELNSSSTSQGLFGFAVRETLRPSTGTYSLISLDDEDPGTNFGMVLLEGADDFGSGSGSFTWHIADGGTIQLTTSEGDRVDSQVSAQVMQVTFDGTTSDTTRVTISGQFAAENGESFIGFQGFTP